MLPLRCASVAVFSAHTQSTPSGLPGLEAYIWGRTMARRVSHQASTALLNETTLENEVEIVIP